MANSTSNTLKVITDVARFPQTQHDCSRHPSMLTQMLTLAANTATTITVPNFSGDYMIGYFKIGTTSTGLPGQVWFLPDASPTVALPPSPGSVTTTTEELNPSAWAFIQGQSFQVITAQTGVTLNIVYYGIQ